MGKGGQREGGTEEQIEGRKGREGGERAIYTTHHTRSSVKRDGQKLTGKVVCSSDLEWNGRCEEFRCSSDVYIERCNSTACTRAHVEVSGQVHWEIWWNSRCIAMSELFHCALGGEGGWEKGRKRKKGRKGREGRKRGGER